MVLALITVGGTVTVARRQLSAFVLVLLSVNALLGSLVVLTFPAYTLYYPGKVHSWIFDAVAIAAFLLVNVAGALVPQRLASSVLGIIQNREGVPRLGLVLLAVLLPIACAETAATIAVKLGAARRYVPTVTRLAVQTEDWRLALIMSDDYREPDPLLLWRPVPRPPYGRQRFKGPDVLVPKPSDLMRVISYGDSNTDGAPDGQAWPNRLNTILGRADARLEVINAGVAGYSSYQGLQRLREEIGIYDPDVVLVSFGWNDVAQAIGPPDRAFAASGQFQSLNPAVIWLRRLLLKYDFILVAQEYMAPPPVESTAKVTYAPRVSLDDYASNLAEFVATARAHGTVPVLLTRPYRESIEALERSPSWRRFVPAYNRRVLEVAASTGVVAVDVQAAFAGRTNLFLDECHFTQEGHAVMARLLAQELGRSRIIW